jgi:hypothetical protein
VRQLNEVALVSRAELLHHTSLIKAKGKNGSLVAIVAGTKTEQVIEHISKLNLKKTSRYRNHPRHG